MMSHALRWKNVKYRILVPSRSLSSDAWKHLSCMGCCFMHYFCMPPNALYCTKYAPSTCAMECSFLHIIMYYLHAVQIVGNFSQHGLEDNLLQIIDSSPHPGFHLLCPECKEDPGKGEGLHSIIVLWSTVNKLIGKRFYDSGCGTV